MASRFQSNLRCFIQTHPLTKSHIAAKTISDAKKDISINDSSSKWGFV
jgi:hypothetical protein